MSLCASWKGGLGLLECHLGLLGTSKSRSHPEFEKKTERDRNGGLECSLRRCVVRKPSLYLESKILMHRLPNQLLLSSEIHLFEGPAEPEPDPGMGPKMIKILENHRNFMFFEIFTSYTCRTVFILSQDAPRTFPTDSESMNLIRAIFLVENQVSQSENLPKSTKFQNSIVSPM